MNSRIQGSIPLSEQVQALRLPAGTSGGGGGGRLLWVVLILLASSTGWMGYRLWKNEPAPAPEAVADKPATPSTSAPEPADTAAPVGEFALESKGYIIAAHQILVSPQVSGRLLVFNIEEGMHVTKGEVLAEIESTEYRADHARALATLELSKQRLLELERGNRPEEIQQAKAELNESQAQLQQLEAEWKRSSLLVRNKSITDQDYEITESKFIAMQRRVDRLSFALRLMEVGPREERIAVARAEVQQAEADVSKTKYRLENCTIRAPVTGTILKKNAEQGNIVNPVALNGSFSVCDMADLADLEISLDVQERDVSRVFPGQKCQIRADAYPKRVYYGTVSRLMPIADRAKGAIPVRVKLQIPADEGGAYLKPEMSAVVSFLSPDKNETPKPLATSYAPRKSSVTPAAPETEPTNPVTIESQPLSPERAPPLSVDAAPKNPE